MTWALGIAESDCERLRDGLIAQPANTLSSLAYVVVGAWVLVGVCRGAVPRRGTALAFGLALVGVGIGSVAFHGPGSSAGRFVHDFSIVALLLVIIGSDLALLRRSWLPAAVAGLVAAAILVAAPDSSNAVAEVLGILAVATEVAVHRFGQLETTRADRVAYAIAAGCLAVAVAAQLLGRTDAPLCDPDSLWQGHALWHVLTALALGFWSVPALRRTPTTSLVLSPSGPTGRGGEPPGVRAPPTSPPAS